MKAYKLFLIFMLTITAFANALAFDCANEQEFVITDEHWMHSLSPEIQYFSILYLSNKIVEECLGEEPSERTKELKSKLEETIGATKVSELEENFLFLFDTQNAFHIFGIDIMDEDFLEKLRNHKLSKG
ncbi:MULTISPECIES: hypothetical protein [Vibrio]|uniref:hypothetical protein n=1 Tax=Vibrio TaxID=662 RepID=UPI0005EDF5CF|nr:MULTISPECIES: hypothetical protein [Vibrio harveyi group]APX05904.1 hypothetical protein BWP24_06865 [Vibrio campbellii]HBH7890514.1 hypothetical protein [Vibrio parahaemolyticus]